jgi:hypothetical protein
VRRESNQIHAFAASAKMTFDPQVRCVPMAVYKNHGKTVLQPLISGQETTAITEMFNNSTLEVWLSNGETDLSKFDVSILKYRQSLQPLTMCQQVKNRACLKNILANLASCEQCPQNIGNGEIPDAKS